MEKRANKYKPAVDRHILLLFAGGVWLVVGAVLLALSYSWLHGYPEKGVLPFAVAGIAAALAISRFGFLKIVDKNVRRILRMEGKRCAFSFVSWKSYFLVVIMVAMGITLRHSSIPKAYLSILYTGVGLALILSSVRYWKVFFRQIRGEDA